MRRRTLLKVPPPPWALNLLAWACVRSRVPIPALAWNLNPSCAPGFAGRAYTKHSRLMVVECADHDYNASSVLHEAAHHIAYQRGLGSGHSTAFYLIVWDLVSAAMLPLDKVIIAEVSYKATAWPALLAFGYTPSPILIEMASLAASRRTLRNAERELERASARLQKSPHAPDTHPLFLAYERSLHRWWKLDRALSAA